MFAGALINRLGGWPANLVKAVELILDVVLERPQSWPTEQKGPTVRGTDRGRRTAKLLHMKDM
jgi:hypothetical protein